MENTVKQRITQYLNRSNISKSEFGRRVGVSSAFVSSMRKSIQPDKAKSIALTFPDLNIEWLLTGEGEMLKPTTPITPQPATPIAESQPPATVDRLLTIIECQQRTIECQQRTIEALTNKLE